MSKYLFSSESVSEGHPDKLCDQISDSILDAYLKEDRESKVAIECFVKNDLLVIGGEVNSKASLNYTDIERIARNTILEIGYDKEEYGFNGNSCKILTVISKQSDDIAKGVNETPEHEQGAGDQGLMFGFATNETPEFMPLPIILAHRLLEKLSQLRRSKIITYLRPDAKSQVTVEYENDKPIRVHTVVLSAQHDENIEYDKLKKDIINKVIKPVCEEYFDENTIIHINPTGRFVIGGPAGDAGLTGRKIIVDSYGGFGRHGGGCFSGKDPSKVDRSGAYGARYIAKNVVANGLADRCEVQIAYAIGLAEPVSFYINCFGTNKKNDEEIIGIIKKNFPIKPGEIIKRLDLKRPIFKTATYGHFGRNDKDFSWENIVNLVIF